MTNHPQQYYITRTCKNCGNADKIFLSKREKAFELYDFDKIWKSHCSVCSSIECLSVGGFPIELDKELLLEWSIDNNLNLMPQDEELFLADEKYINIIIDLIDNYEILEVKRMKLIESLCVIIYDNIIDNNDDNKILNKNEALIDRVTNELIKRKELVLAADGWIFDYIKEVVYPKIGLTKNGS